MPAPSVKGYMPLSVTPRSLVCDEQGVGQWPMWKRFDSVKAIIDQYIDEPYRNFLARPEFDVDRQKAEEYFFWYTPRCDSSFIRLSSSGDDHNYYSNLLKETLSHYHSAVERLKADGKAEEASFLELSLKHAGESEDNVYCGDGLVVATAWGMRQRQGVDLGDSKLESVLDPPSELHSVRFNLGDNGTTKGRTLLKKGHGTRLFDHQVPQVTPKNGFQFDGWQPDPRTTLIDDDMSFEAQYTKIHSQPPQPPQPPQTPPTVPPAAPTTHHVRFLSPSGDVLKEIEVDHGQQILPGLIPQLPVVDGLLCPAWDGNPLSDTITADRDYKALAPPKPELPLRTVRFLNPDKEVLSQFQVAEGARLSQSLIPPLPVIDGQTCPGWDTDPLSVVINSDRDFVARKPKRNGLLSAILKWLLLLLAILLLFLLLWCFVFGKCHFNLCGCDCDCQEQVNPYNPVVPVQKPCNSQQASGGEEGYVGYFDMGQNSGTFPFAFDTYTIPDKVSVYEGKGTKGKLLYSFDGGSGGTIYENIRFDAQWVTVEIVGYNSGTSWEFNIGCPNN